VLLLLLFLLLLRALLEEALGMEEAVDRIMRLEDGRTAMGLGELMSLTELAVLASVVVLSVPPVLAVSILSRFPPSGAEESKFGALTLVKPDCCLCRALESSELSTPWLSLGLLISVLFEPSMRIVLVGLAAGSVRPVAGTETRDWIPDLYSDLNRSE
jgi:hypothetical protein